MYGYNGTLSMGTGTKKQPVVEVEMNSVNLFCFLGDVLDICLLKDKHCKHTIVLSYLGLHCLLRPVCLNT